MVKLIMKIYAWIRRKLNPLVLPKAECWFTTYSKMKIQQYSAFVNSFEYKSDKLGGLLDKTETFEHFIDKTVETDRDCDDWARMWSFWGIYNGFIAHEFILLNPKHPFKTAHVVTVLEKNDKFTLCNYKYYKAVGSLEEALDLMRSSPSYVDSMLYVVNDEFEPVDNPE